MSTEELKRLRERIARLSGSSAILKIGAHSKTELANMRAQAEKAFTALTGMSADGVVPGGGAAFLAAIPAVRSLRESRAGLEDMHGVDLLLAALEAPMLQIARNHGRFHPPVVLAESQRLGCGYGLDVSCERVVNSRCVHSIGPTSRPEYSRPQEPSEGFHQ